MTGMRLPMSLQDAEAILGTLPFRVGNTVKVYPLNRFNEYEPEPGITGTVAAIFVIDDNGIHNPEELTEIDNERLGSVWYFGIDFDPNDPLLAESDDHGGYYLWELEAA